MSKFHSTVSRRDFMKGLGLAGAGLGAAAAAAPVFHDLDELATSDKPQSQHPWYVKERDHEDPTTIVDWDVFEPYDRIIAYAHPPGLDERILSERAERYAEGIRNNSPSMTLRDYALSWGARGCTPPNEWDGPPYTRSTIAGLFPTKISEWGISPWQGTPEENLKMVRAALHVYGSPRVGAIELTEHTKRLFDKGKVVWEDIDVAYKDNTGVAHIPNKCRWALVWLTKQSTVQNLYSIGDPDEPFSSNKPLGGLASSQAYSHGPQIAYQAMKFLKGLGYQALKPSARINIVWGVFGGLVEQGRTGYSCSPEYGLLMRYNDFAVTDLPLAPSKPIDGGIRTFCKSCKTCATRCPSSAISMDTEPTWDVGASEGQIFNRPGINTWRLDWKKCIDLGAPWNCCWCQASCPLNHMEKALIHSLVSATIATTPIFNGFFANMEGAFGYTKIRHGGDPDKWWDRDLNNWPYDTLYGFGTAGW